MTATRIVCEAMMENPDLRSAVQANNTEAMKEIVGNQLRVLHRYLLRRLVYHNDLKDSRLGAHHWFYLIMTGGLIGILWAWWNNEDYRIAIFIGSMLGLGICIAQGISIGENQIQLDAVEVNLLGMINRMIGA
jgi:hypothetical protein